MDQVPEVCKNAQDPKDAVAFKMVSEDQRAMTTILDVEWNSSRTKTWIPRILFTPVHVGTVVISCCTGVHAQNVVEKGLGIGAQIIIRRSGDVIPIIDSVLVPATTLKMPPEGRWAWDERNVHAIDTSTEMSSESKALHIVHTLTHMGIEGIRASTAMKLVEVGIDSIANIGKTSSTKLQEIVGPKTGSKLSVELKECFKKAQEKNWVLAYPSWPKGFGDVRMDAALLLEPSVTKWPSLTKSPQKMGMDSFKEIQNCVPAFLAWRQEIMTVFGISSVSTVSTVSTASTASTTTASASTASTASASTASTSASIVKNGKTYVMSGFRDKEISLLLDAAGWEQQDRITKTTTVLLVPDDAKETEKVRAARTAGVRIVVRSQIKSIL
jgi:NAD-dependent DNA ligase